MKQISIKNILMKRRKLTATLLAGNTAATEELVNGSHEMSCELLAVPNSHVQQKLDEQYSHHKKSMQQRYTEHANKMQEVILQELLSFSVNYNQIKDMKTLYELDQLIPANYWHSHLPKKSLSLYFTKTFLAPKSDPKRINFLHNLVLNDVKLVSLNTKIYNNSYCINIYPSVLGRENCKTNEKNQASILTLLTHALKNARMCYIDFFESTPIFFNFYLNDALTKFKLKMHNILQKYSKTKYINTKSNLDSHAENQISYIDKNLEKNSNSLLTQDHTYCVYISSESNWIFIDAYCRVYAPIIIAAAKKNFLDTQQILRMKDQFSALPKAMKIYTASGSALDQLLVAGYK